MPPAFASCLPMHTFETLLVWQHVEDFKSCKGKVRTEEARQVTSCDASLS